MFGLGMVGQMILQMYEFEKENEMYGYDKGYDDGLKMGRILGHDKPEKKKLTREEAVKKCHGIAYPEVFVQTLEALGLIEFAESEEAIKVFDSPGMNCTMDYLIRRMDSLGYQIVKKV